VIVVDLNLLLYATNRDTAHHDAAREWWETALSGKETVGMAWAVVLGFVRISTNARILPAPLAAKQAFAVVDEWLARPNVVLIEPTERHWGIVKDLLEPLGTAGNLTTDAHLAALAIERGAKLCSADRDFGRFPHLRWIDPLATSG
jgi:hypothetical protein